MSEIKGMDEMEQFFKDSGCLNDLTSEELVKLFSMQLMKIVEKHVNKGGFDIDVEINGRKIVIGIYVGDVDQ